jgi:hypothetical protein
METDNNNTLEYSARLRSEMPGREFTNMDIVAVRTWFTIVGILAGVALSLWCVNMFIFKRQEIVQILRKHFSHIAPRAQNRKQGSPMMTSRRIDTSDMRLLATNRANLTVHAPQLDSDNESTGQ